MDSRANHLLYILTDSNLPTGGFIASSGLESYITHGFIQPQNYTATSDGLQSTSSASNKDKPKAKSAEWMIHLGEVEMDNYASTTVPFVLDTWYVLDYVLGQAIHETAINGEHDSQALEQTLRILATLDLHHEASSLSHVSRRASKAQGVALLTLYAKAFNVPSASKENLNGRARDSPSEARAGMAGMVVARYKTLVRSGEAPGHLAICWGILCAAVGLTRGESYSPSLLGVFWDVAEWVRCRAMFPPAHVSTRSITLICRRETEPDGTVRIDFSAHTHLSRSDRTYHGAIRARHDWIGRVGGGHGRRGAEWTSVKTDRTRRA